MAFIISLRNIFYVKLLIVKRTLTFQNNYCGDRRNNLVMGLAMIGLKA
jgi:hypothetical protein